MQKLRVVGDSDAATAFSGAALFGILWEVLTDSLGTATTAVVMDRAARRARRRSHELDLFTVSRLDGQFAYALPPSFIQGLGPPTGLCHLLDELRPLLVELTGQLTIRRLDAVPALCHWVPRPSASA